MKYNTGQKWLKDNTSKVIALQILSYFKSLHSFKKEHQSQMFQLQQGSFFFHGNFLSSYISEVLKKESAY